VETSDIAQLLKIYNGNETLAEQLENLAMSSALTLSTKSAGEIMINAGHVIKQVELVEICEKVVVSGLDLYSETPSGPQELLEVMIGFH